MKTPSPEAKLLRQLSAEGARIRLDGETIVLESGNAARQAVAVDRNVFRRLRASGALGEDGAGGWTLSTPGAGLARRLASASAPSPADHQLRGRREIVEDGRARWVDVDLGESPLAWLRARRGKDGEPLIDDAAFQAGERLRSDFTRGQMMPSVTANWSLAGRPARGGGAAGGIGELTDAALAARLRVERALSALGPELAGVVLDFCCFLKGIETIERERNWPKRSARLILQLALSVLARHYGFAGQAVGNARRSGEGRDYGAAPPVNPPPRPCP